VVHGQNRHRYIEGSIVEGKVLGHSPHSPAPWVLAKHDAGGFEGHDRAIG
jgi:hypothetical protein